MAENSKYDLLLRGGRVICPASGIDGIRDVAVRGGRVAAVENTILPSSATEVIDVSGKLMLPGLIDTRFILSCPLISSAGLARNAVLIAFLPRQNCMRSIA